MLSGQKKLFYSYVKNKLRSQTPMPPLLNENGNLILAPIDKANLLNNTFSKVFLDDDDGKHLPKLPPFVHKDSGEMPDIHVTTGDVLDAISNLKNSMSRTPDNVPTIFIKKVSKVLAKPLAILFNLSLKKGKIPKFWKLALVVPIFKKGETNKTTNYRPISLTSLLCRILEKIIHRKITTYLINNNLLSEHQHGFIFKRSTLTQQLYFFNKLTKLHKEKTPCHTIYIDFSKAFDKISHNKLLYVLNYFKINAKTINWINDFLSGRSQQTIVEEHLSDSCLVTSGVPQGSVLGPLLFVLYLDSLLINISNSCKYTHVYAFADDLKLLSVDAEDLQKSLNIVEAWASDWSLYIQPAKSEHIFFPNNKNYLNNSSTPTFFLNNIEIPQRKTVRDLGIVLSHDFKWSPYISQITSKAHNLSYTILHTFKTQDYNTYLNLYKTHIRPILEYNTPIWTPFLKQDKDKVEKVQEKFTKRLCQKLNIKFSNYKDRLRIFNLESLQDRRNKFDLILVYKIRHNLIDINFEDFFGNNMSAKRYNIRGHRQLLNVPSYSGSSLKHHYFSNRVLEHWNSLPADVVDAENISIFKFKLTKYFATKNSHTTTT